MLSRVIIVMTFTFQYALITRDIGVIKIYVTVSYAKLFLFAFLQFIFFVTLQFIERGIDFNLSCRHNCLDVHKSLKAWVKLFLIFNLLIIITIKIFM